MVKWPGLNFLVLPQIKVGINTVNFKRIQNVTLNRCINHILKAVFWASHTSLELYDGDSEAKVHQR